MAWTDFLDSLSGPTARDAAREFMHTPVPAHISEPVYDFLNRYPPSQRRVTQAQFWKRYLAPSIATVYRSHALERYGEDWLKNIRETGRTPYLVLASSQQEKRDDLPDLQLLQDCLYSGLRHVSEGQALSAAESYLVTSPTVLFDPLGELIGKEMRRAEARGQQLIILAQAAPLSDKTRDLHWQNLHHSAQHYKGLRNAIDAVAAESALIADMLQQARGGPGIG